MTEVSQATIEAFCRRNHIRRLSYFGSVLRDDFTPESDTDILVDFEEGHLPSYFALVAMERDLSELFGRKVDLRTPGEISPRYRDEVLSSARVTYEAALEEAGPASPA